MKKQHPNRYFVRGLISALLVSIGLLPLHAQQTNPSGSETKPTDSASPLTPKATAAAGAEEEVITLSPFVVDASKDQGYRATSTLAGSRINTQLKDVAAPITVLTKEFLDDLGAVGINDVLNYVAGGEGTGSFTFSLPGVGNYPDDQIVQNPTGATRIRGLSAPDYTRDYFYTVGGSIGFDTFNLDTVTINRGPNSILAGLGSAAGIIDYSPQMAALNRNSNYLSYQLGSWGSQRATLNSNYVLLPNKLAIRVAGAWTDKEFKQKPSFSHDKRYYAAATYQPWASTTIRASYEKDSVDRSLPNSMTPIDSISQWRDRGSPTASPPATPSFNFPTWTEQGTLTILVNKDHAVETSYPVNKPFQYTYLQQNLNNVPIWVPLAMNSNKYIDLQNTNISAQNADLNFKAFNASIDQQIFTRDLNANISYTKENYDGTRIKLTRPQYTVVFVDVNQTTPTGAVNPHFGETYIEQRGLDNKGVENASNEVVRGTLTYDLDLTKHSKWFGKWRATGFLEQRETETEGISYTTNAYSSGTNLGQVQIRHYLGGKSDSQATSYPQYQGLLSGVTNTYSPSTGTFAQRTIYLQNDQGADNKQLTKLDTAAFVLQSYLWDDRIVGLYGYRKDTNKAGNLSQSGSPIAPGTPYPTLSEVSGRTKTYGVVFHATKWLSFHYNKSENFVPNAGSIDLLGNIAPPPTGSSKDYGVSFSLLDDRLNIRINHFDTQAANGDPGFNADFLGQWVFPWFDRVQMAAIARDAGKSYTPGILPGLIEGDPRLAHGYGANNVSKGLEIEATYNVTKNWRVMGSISSNEAKLSGIASPLTDLVEKRIAYYKAQGLWNGPVGGAVWGAAATGEQQWNTWALPYYIGYKASENKPSQQLAKWHASALTTYNFTEGRLAGWNVGGGIRYVDKSIIGNPAILNASGAVIGLDTDHPYTTAADIGLDAWIGYKMKVWRDKATLDFSLHGYDLQESGHFKPILANSDGTHAAYRIVQPRSFYFTSALSF